MYLGGWDLHVHVATRITYMYYPCVHVHVSGEYAHIQCIQVRVIYTFHLKNVEHYPKKPARLTCTCMVLSVTSQDKQ